LRQWKLALGYKVERRGSNQFSARRSSRGKPRRRIGETRTPGFLNSNPRSEKPRRTGLTEIRGPYYTPVGPRYLTDLFEMMGAYVDSLKFAGGSFALMPRDRVREVIEIAHRFDVEVSTGGFIERVLPGGRRAVEEYIGFCAELGFDTIEVSAGFISIPTEDLVRLIKRVQKEGLKAKPEVGIQFGAGGASAAETLDPASSPQLAIDRAKRFLDAGASLIMIESEGITESVKTWRSEVPAQFATALGLEHLMFEAADPAVFGWYVKNFGPEVNLFADHSQIVQLEALRQGIWGTADLWGRVVSYKG
jgi:phosphosulfolactate synthase (CoM biosynthesis protein A)